MTCKECIHYDLCRSCSRIQLGWHGNSVHYVENIEEICKDFKDRSQFVELPCKLGDTVYYFNSAGEIFSQKVSGFIVNFVGILIDSDVMFNSNLIGKRFFLTREAAEQALKERES